MAEKDQIDHDALAAEWGVALEAEQNPAGAAEVIAERGGRQSRRRDGLAMGHDG